MVYDEMVKQANRYKNPKDQSRYLDAAAKFRLPYWDPLMPRNLQADGARFDTVWGLPELLKRPQVFLRHPDQPEVLKPFDNPMYKFVFPKNWDPDPARRYPRATLFQGDVMNPNETMRTPKTVVARAGPDLASSKIVSAKTDIETLNLSIQRQNVTHASRLWKMLNYDETQLDSQGRQVFINRDRPWSYFANHNAVHGSGRRVEEQSLFKGVSLESWHDAIHNMIGQGQLLDQQGTPIVPEGRKRLFTYVGQMANPAVAAFEPMFWMHHNNIDRLLSLYQAIYHKNVDDGNDERIQRVDNPLIPFVKDQSMKYWTSGDGLVKNYWSPGFGTPGVSPMAEKAVRDKTQEYLSNTYLWAQNNGPAEQRAKLPLGWPKNLSDVEALTGKPAKGSSRTTSTFQAIVSNNGIPTLIQGMAAEAKPITVQHTMSRVAALAAEMPLLKTEAATNQQVIQVWDAHIRVRKYAFDGSFSVHVFIGHVKDEQPQRYMTKKNEVGFMGVFSRSTADLEHCDNCQRSQQADLMCSDVVPLTSYLQDYLETNPRAHELIEVGQIKTLPDLEAEHVIPFLKEHLQWRMTDLGSQNRNGDEQQAGLCVAVSKRTYTMPTEANPAGVYGPETMEGLQVITEGKPGGRGYRYQDGTVVQW